MESTTLFWGLAVLVALLLGGGGYAFLYRRRTATGLKEISPRETAKDSSLTVSPEPQATTAEPAAPPPLQTAPTEHLERCARMASVFAHDFNNIMTAIGGYASLLQKRLTDDERATRFVKGIIEAEKHASELLDRLSLIAGNDRKYSVAIEVNDMLRDVCNEFASLPGTTRVLPPDCCTGPVYTAGNSKLFRLAIVNLCTNAIDACKETGGTVQFSTETLDSGNTPGDNLPPSLAPGAYIHISVNDTGIGMNEQVRRHLFDPFYTTKPKGKAAGLGLSIVWRYVTSCNGTIELDSAPGKGTTFHLYFPQLAEPASTKESSGTGHSIGRSPSTGPLSVLVVDDEASVREIYSEILEDSGYAVNVCTNGREACDFVNDSSTPVDLVVLDVMMPVMDGITTFSRLRESHPDIKILLMSGYHTSDSIGHLLTQPATDFFKKPGNSDLLLDKIRTLLAA